jgi:regulator of sigma E protease
MNILFAWVVFSGLLATKGIPVLATTTVGSVDAAALPPGAAGLGSIVAGDRILSVGESPVESWQAVQRGMLDTTAGPGLEVVFERAGRMSLSLPDPADRRAAFNALRPDLQAVVGEVLPGRPGAAAGLAVGDTILTFDGEPIGQWVDLVDRISARADQEVVLVVGRASGRTELRATPAPEAVVDSAGARTVGRLGIIGPLLPEAREPIGIGAAAIEGARRTAFVSTQIVGVVQGMFSGRVSTSELGGPIAIGVAAGQSARRGAEDFLIFMAAISVNLAILNLLPIPVLDGGQFLFLLAEAVTRRPITGKVREWLSLAGLAMIVMLMVLAFSNDIRRLLGF